MSISSFKLAPTIGSPLGHAVPTNLPSVLRR